MSLARVLPIPPVAAVSIDRSARLPELVDVEREPAAALAALRVAFLGIGSVGMHAVDAIARLGVRAITLIDPGRVKEASLLTHPVQPADLGRSKAMLAGERAKAASPATRVTVIDAAVQDAPFDALLDADFILLAGDNLACELFAGERALQLAVPLIQASVHGGTLTVQVRALGHASPGACLMCGWSAREWDDLDRGTRFSCEGGAAAAGSAAPRASAVPTRSLPQLCGAAGQLAGLELVRRALGIVPAGTSHLVELNGYTLRTVTSPLARNPRCPVEHTAWTRAQTPRAVGELTPAELFALAGAEPREATLELPGLAYAAAAGCACGPETPLGRFVFVGPDSAQPGSPVAAPVAVTCPACGETRRPHPFHLHRDVPPEALRSHLATPLSHLGAPDASIALVNSPRGATVLHHATPESHP